MTEARTCPICGTELPSDGVCVGCQSSAGIKEAKPGEQSTIVVNPALSGTEKPGERIGHYKLLRQIGEGGMGTVWLAEQQEPVRRRVALKVIKLGMDTREVVARFEAERQALALMHHPNIAEVLEAGATDTGRPFFVMELVSGDPITSFCDKHKLSTEERLNLFIQVCQAVQHAHQKGIIHRDLKPSNILVAYGEPAGAPVPKIIDFGISKAVAGQRLTDKTLVTQFEQFIGTPAYVSPEQAEMSGVDIDTRSDIYSLGVLLYELLTGMRPFEDKRLIEAGIDEIRRIIREEDPPRPSARLSTLSAKEQTTVAERRRSQSPKLFGAIRGDLDWIVMKCLEKDRNRRYDNANGIAADIQRHLRSEPVVARPPSAAYRFEKLVRRNKLAFGAAAAVLVVLLGGIVTSTWQAIRATRAEREQSRLREQAQLNARRAELEAAKSKQVAAFLQDMLKGVGPSVALGRDTTMLREILDRTAERVGKQLKDQPAVEAEMETTIGEAYYAIAEDRKAKAKLENAVAIRRNLPGGNNLDLAASMQDLAMVLWRLSSFDEAEDTAREGLALTKKSAGSNDFSVAASLETLGTVLNSKGRLEEAETLLRDALALRNKGLGGQDLSFAETLGNLSAVLQRRGALNEAEQMARESLALKRRFLDVHPSVAIALNSLAYVLNEEHKLDEAETLHREAVAMRRQLLGKAHPELMLSLINLADVLAAQGKLEEAESTARESLAMRRTLNIGEDLETCGYLNHTAAILQKRKKFTEAEELSRQALAIEQKQAKHPSRTEQFTLFQLGNILKDQGRSNEAEAVYQEALAMLKEVSPDNPQMADLLANLTSVLLQNQKFDLAEKHARQCLSIRKAKEPNDWQTSYTESLLGETLMGQKKLAEAEPLLLSGYEGLKQRETQVSNHAKIFTEVLQRLARCYEAEKRADKAAEWKAKLAEVEKSAPSASNGR